jgi:plasmid stabilization system protein ParE
VSEPKTVRPRELKWAATALADLKIILRWLDEHRGVNRSMEFEEELRSAINPLVVFPHMGRTPTDFKWGPFDSLGLREILVDHYRVGYSVGANTVTMLYVIHTRRQMPPID